MPSIRLIIFILLIGCSPVPEGNQGTMLITPNRLTSLLEEGDVQLIDVRTQDEIASGKINGARHIDYYDEEFISKVNSLDKDKPVVIYCASGIRSAKAAEQMQGMGFKALYDLEGGIRAWQLAGYRIDSP